VQAVANTVATAVERSAAGRRLIEVREAERRRIARDLHDEALQDLTYTITGAQALLSPTEAVDRLAGLVPALKRVSAQLRGAIYDLRLAGEQDRPFPELLGALVASHSAMAPGCDITLEIGDGVRENSIGRVGTQVLRILGEALNNARRHSGAASVHVRVWGSSRKLAAEVSDDGRGAASALIGSDDAALVTGVKGMRERADMVGGYLDIESAPGQGTKVLVEVPLDPSADPDHETRILLVEDHVVLRQALASAFDAEPGMEVVGQAGSLTEARAMLEDVDVAILDLGLPDGFGGDLIDDLHVVNRRAHALVLTATVDPAQLARAIDHGAAGAVNKAAPLNEVVESVRRLGRGEMLLSIDQISEILRFARTSYQREREDRAAIAELTPREREVLQALADGLDSQAISRRLNISIRTERNHVSNIIAKLGVHSQLQALVFALRYGVVELRPPTIRPDPPPIAVG
jgi:DNA-binding NarL/FixJ family response regulator